MLLNIVEVIGGLVLLIWGADRFVHGAAATARNMGIAPLLIGLTIVAFATSAPEILVSVVAALRGEPDLAFGNAIGSNIANIGLVLGSIAIVRPIELRGNDECFEMVIVVARDADRGAVEALGDQFFYLGGFHLAIAIS